LLSMAKIKVLVADDHPTFQQGLCTSSACSRTWRWSLNRAMVSRLLQREDIISGRRRHRHCHAKINGVEAARQIKEACPDTNILMLSAYDYESYLVGAIRAGASGYLLKSAPVSELINAIRLVRTGEAVFDLKSISSILNGVTAKNGDKRTLPDLHQREIDVLKSAAKGSATSKLPRSSLSASVPSRLTCPIYSVNSGLIPGQKQFSTL